MLTLFLTSSRLWSQPNQHNRLLLCVIALNTALLTNLQILNDLRTALGATPSKSPLPKSLFVEELDELVARHLRATQSVPLGITGRHLPLLYLLVSTLVAPPHRKAVVIVDEEGRFDVTRLTCLAPDLAHIYVYRPARGSLEYVREVVAGAEAHMLYGRHASMTREWWGTIVIGGMRGGDINASWKGWLRVDREDTRPFGHGISSEEALAQRDRRQAAVDSSGWRATSQWGDFHFPDCGPVEISPPKCP
jgi:hypothetical protein